MLGNGIPEGGGRDTEGPVTERFRGTSNRPDSEDLSVQIGVYWV